MLVGSFGSSFWGAVRTLGVWVFSSFSGLSGTLRVFRRLGF